MKNIMAVFLSAILLMNLSGCAQPAAEGEAGGQTPETDALSNLYGAQVIREILARHENVEENAIYFDAQGDVAMSVYQYADSEMVVREDDRSRVDIQYRDGYYAYDPDTMDRVQVAFGMEGVAEAQWEDCLSSSIEFNSSEGEELAGLTESDGRMILTIVSEVEEDVPGWEDFIEPGTQSVYTIEVDPETYVVYEGESYLKKPDGTEAKFGEFRFRYDVTPYEPSEEMLQVINGTDKTLTLIADPGTEQERTYVKSCGENGKLGVMSADGYDKFYQDEACTQESVPSDENGERTVYTVKRAQ